MSSEDQTNQVISEQVCFKDILGFYLQALLRGGGGGEPHGALYGNSY